MLPPPRIFARFLDGREGEFLEIARLPIEWGAHIGALTQTVKIERTYAIKIKNKHRLLYDHFGLLQLCIDYGTIIHERNGCLTFFLEDSSVYGTTFELVVKATQRGHELWVATYHKVDPLEYRSTFNKGQVLRYQTQ